MTDSDLTVGEIISSAVVRLSGAGCPSPEADVEQLALHATGWSRTELILTRRDFVPADSPLVRVFPELIGRREAREPLQHIIGTAAMMDLDLLVGPGVFVPRPETELLVDWAAQRLNAGDLVVDLCTGSGAIALGVAALVPGVHVIGVEADPVALEWARRNAERITTNSTVEFIAGDATDPELLTEFTGRCTAVLSNPPYVPEETAVDPEVRADPHHAVFGGVDGLDVIRPMMKNIKRLLNDASFTAIEHDDDGADGVAQAFFEAGFSNPTVHRDLAGRDRFTTAVE